MILGGNTGKSSIIEQGVNDLETYYPDVKRFWDYNKNILKPKDVFYNSRTNFWMKCEKSGHSFKTSPYLLQKHYNSKFT